MLLRYLGPLRVEVFGLDSVLQGLLELAHLDVGRRPGNNAWMKISSKMAIYVASVEPFDN